MNEFVNRCWQEAKTLLTTLATIPAPSLCEEQRAVFCKEWLLSQGADRVMIDDAYNVICPFGDISGDVVIIAAHSDVVFPDRTPLPLEERDGRLYCPGIGDDTANVTALLMTAKYLLQNGKQPKHGGVLLVVNAAEEGLGNLKGSRLLADTYGDRVKAFISFDCYAEEVINDAVGSVRYRVTVNTVGGHSYFDFGNRNAIAILSELITEIYTLSVPDHSHSTYNVGTIEGGTSVNTIAQTASCLCEFRSNRKEALEMLCASFERLIERYRCEDVSLNVSMMGERPCANGVDAQAQQALTQTVCDILRRRFSASPTVKDGSTDCNTFLSRGIPSVCFGCVKGAGMHTREEYIEIDSLTPGLLTALETVLTFF